ncbi:hypothetical protein [Janthinobacterium sp.]|uniref:hypothetical protein n=1 Tax=Janthinobacterium sp. TaxID=1871054 RepID=UPI002DBFF2C9|nr:hypothetical protein [Janthinobacterium sp.]HEU4818466.1 hypothetical protein [Janthinobacterium sp.]
MEKYVGPLPPNPTENQHFIAQAVQGLNAAPSENGKISHIQVYRRVGENTISLVNKGGLPIRHNLALLDLYTFDLTGSLRRNFESLFQRYEEDLPRKTLSLVKKIRANTLDLHDEIISIIGSKMLDFIRNPYSIHKCLAMFPNFATFHPTSAESNEIYQRIWDGNNPRQERICRLLGITSFEYRRWLVTIFMLTYEHPGMSETFLDQIIHSLITSRENYAATHFFIYDRPAVLLSDRSFNEIDNEKIFAMEFHASAELIVTFMVLNLNEWEFKKPLKITKKSIDAFKNFREPMLQAFIVKNEEEILKSYNQRTVAYCHQNVYGVAKSFPGIKIQETN